MDLDGLSNLFLFSLNLVKNVGTNAGSTKSRIGTIKDTHGNPRKRFWQD